MKNKRGKSHRYFRYNFFPKNRRGISGIVVTMLMIALVVVVTTIVWTAINSLIKENISSSQDCFGNFGKITLDKKYTCYDSDINVVRFSINIADIKVDDLLISISNGPVNSSEKETWQYL